MAPVSLFKAPPFPTTFTDKPLTEYYRGMALYRIAPETIWVETLGKVLVFDAANEQILEFSAWAAEFWCRLHGEAEPATDEQAAFAEQLQELGLIELAQ